MTQKTKSARWVHRIGSVHIFIGLIVQIGLTLAYFEYAKHQRMQAVADVARNGEVEVLKLFRAWKFDQPQGDRVVQWSGENAEVLFLPVVSTDHRHVAPLPLLAVRLVDDVAHRDCGHFAEVRKHLVQAMAT